MVPVPTVRRRSTRPAFVAANRATFPAVKTCPSIIPVVKYAISRCNAATMFVLSLATKANARPAPPSHLARVSAGKSVGLGRLVVSSEFDLPCTAATPSCHQTCDRLLACGHRCPHSCRPPPCPPCEQFVLKACRCGATQKQCKCSEVLLCTTRCNALKACGVHRCNRRCCDGQHAPCTQVAASRVLFSRRSAISHSPADDTLVNCLVIRVIVRLACSPSQSRVTAAPPRRRCSAKTTGARSTLLVHSSAPNHRIVAIHTSRNINVTLGNAHLVHCLAEKRFRVATHVLLFAMKASLVRLVPSWWRFVAQEGMKCSRFVVRRKTR